MIPTNGGDTLGLGEVLADAEGLELGLGDREGVGDGEGVGVGVGVGDDEGTAPPIVITISAPR